MDVVVNRLTALLPVSAEMLEDRLPSWGEIEAAATAFAALPPEEQERILAERKAAYEAERCTACGCHPDEHRDG